MPHPLSRIPATVLVAGGLLAAGVAAAGALTASGAMAATPSPTSTSKTPGGGPMGYGRAGGGMPGGGPGHGFGGGPFGMGRGAGTGGRTLHGEFTVQKSTGGGTEVDVVQTGTIQTVSGDAVTVKSSDGFTLTWTMNDSTKVRTGWQSGSVKDLAKGDPVTLEGVRSGTGTVASMVGERPARAPGAGTAGPGGSIPTPSATTGT